MNTRTTRNDRDALRTGRAPSVRGGSTALPPLTRRRAASLFGDDSGAATAEYAITTMAAVVRRGHTLP